MSLFPIFQTSLNLIYRNLIAVIDNTPPDDSDDTVTVSSYILDRLINREPVVLAHLVTFSDLIDVPPSRLISCIEHLLLLDPRSGALSPGAEDDSGLEITEASIRHNLTTALELEPEVADAFVAGLALEDGILTNAILCETLVDSRYQSTLDQLFTFGLVIGALPSELISRVEHLYKTPDGACPVEAVISPEDFAFKQRARALGERIAETAPAVFSAVVGGLVDIPAMTREGFLDLIESHMVADGTQRAVVTQGVPFMQAFCTKVPSK
jgi:hypothetical protein